MGANGRCFLLAAGNGSGDAAVKASERCEKRRDIDEHHSERREGHHDRMAVMGGEWPVEQTCGDMGGMVPDTAASRDFSCSVTGRLT